MNWRVAPSGFDNRMAHVFTEIETARGITYWRSACGRKVFTMGDKQLTERGLRECCQRCENIILGVRRVA